MHYIIGENIFREEHYNQLHVALDRLQLPYTTVRIFPFVNKIVDVKNIPSGAFNVDELPEIEFDKKKKVFVFGAIKLARIAWERGWKPGSMMNLNHDFLVYFEHYKQELLNYDSAIYTVGSKFVWKPNEVKFIRPTFDSKSFTGKVFNETEWNDTVENYLHNYKTDQFNENTPIQVTTPKNIYKEIRCWVVNGKVVTASVYKLGTQVIYLSEVETEAIEYAERMVNKFALAPAFVIDVCLTDDQAGNQVWKIVECGCINAAGFYKSDLQKTIIALEKYFDTQD